MPSRRPMLAAATTLAAVVSLVTLAGPALAADDYPYAGMGRCPLVPLPPPVDPPDDGSDEQSDGGRSDAKDGKDAEDTKNVKDTNADEGAKDAGPRDGQGEPGSDPTETVDVPRECAKNVWYLNGSMADPWGFALRHCTSFVTWRLRETNGAGGFSNYLAGGHFGNAQNWDENARDLGFLVDDVPAVGAVAQTDDGVYGHVAWVSAVHEDGTVTVEEYNHAGPGIYGTRTVPASDFRYVHVRDIAPGATSGSQRTLVTASRPGAEQTWTARVTAAGDLVLGRPSGRTQRVGAPGAWSRFAAPALSVDADGRLHLAGVTADGRLALRHTDDRGRLVADRLRLTGGWSPNASPVLADVAGRTTLWATTARGDLVERRLRPGTGGRWGRPERVGRAASWSTHAAPAVAVDGEGDTWLAAVTRSGRLLVRHSRPGGGWTGLVAVGTGSGGAWSRVAGPALTADADGRIALHAVTATGGLVARTTADAEDGRPFGPARTVGGAWSPYATPAVVLDRSGRLWLAAVTRGGSLSVRRTTPDSTQWRPARTVGTPRTWSPGRGVSLVPAVRGGVRLLAERTDGAVRARPVGTGERPVTTGLLRAGFEA